MSEITNLRYKNIRKALGAELKRVRLEKGISLEQAAQDNQIDYPKMIENWEEGKGHPFFVLIRLVLYYKKRLKIELVD